MFQLRLAREFDLLTKTSKAGFVFDITILRKITPFKLSYDVHSGYDLWIRDTKYELWHYGIMANGLSILYTYCYQSHEIIRIQSTLLHGKCIISLLMSYCLLSLTYKIRNINISYHQSFLKLLADDHATS